jgi:4-amino-4-deoxy-L-arabinose transferase-like glycosyltransferase
MTSRAASLSLVILLWAALYLRLLGLWELRGEEGKPVMRAVQLLDDGNYLVPYLGARPFLNKPPLVTWLVVASLRAFGVRKESTPRLPPAIFWRTSRIFLLYVYAPVVYLSTLETVAGECAFSFNSIPRPA